MTHSSNVGLTCLLNGGENPKADVVLVHGFGGHPKSTWSKSTLSTKQDGQRVPDETQTRGRRRYRFHDAERLKNKQANAQGTAIVPIGNASAEGSQLNLAGSASSDTSSKVFWPHDLLGLDFPSVRVMAYGYQPDQEESLQANLLSLSNHLLSTLESERRGVAGRPIVFIAHSLGGILVKKALDLSRLSTASIRNVTKGVIFFGTPHCKPHGKSWGELLKRIPGEFVATNTTLFTTLDSQLNEEELEAIRDVFEKMLSRPSNKKLFVVTFTGAVVGGPAGSTSCPVIPVESARINSSWAKTRTLEGTHETMCEFSSPSDPNYQLLKVELLLALQIIDDGKRKKEKQKLERKDRRDMQKQFLVQGEWFPKLLACPYWERKDEPNPPQTEGTCEWFLDHALYKYWRNSYTANILCVSADPGYGKSVLARHVAENVLPSNKSRLTCYFFFNNDYSDQKSVTGALLCILHQVFKDFPADFCPKALQTIIKNYEKTLELFHNFWDILLSVAERRKIKEVLCILDALDESSEPGRGQFIKALGKLHSQSRIKAVRLKFLVTSRPYLDTSSLGHQRVNLHLSGESDRGVGRISEVKFAIQQKAGTLIQKHRLGPEDGDFLIAELCRNPYPTYLWVYLVVEEADNILLNKENIQLKIQKLPQTVEEAYKNILAKVGDAESTRRVLHIILAAQRPLTLKEMSFALAIGPGHKPPGDNKLVPEAKVCNDIQDLCGAFVRIVNSKIYLVHQTAREFLVSSHEPVQPLDTNDDISPTSSSQWKSTFKPQESHQILAEICLERIALSDCRLDQHQDNMETSDDDVKGYPLMSYASQHWAEHFRKGDGMHKASIIKTAMDCFIARPLASQAWFGIHQTAGNFYVGPDKPTALALAAYFGLGVVVERLPKDALDTVNERSSGLTPLQWAVRGGHRGVVQQLIAAGADVDLRAEDGRAALHFAAERNDRVLMQQLVAAGANTNTHDMLKRTALHLAAGKGHPDMVQQLLAAGAAANIQDIHGKTALLSAMDSGNSVVVQRLVAGGSDISIQDTMGQTSLQRAAKRGHIDIVQLLMGAGADIRVRDKEGQTALHHAASQGREAVVRQLIAAGSDIRTGDRRDRTPLELAARKRSGDVVQLLVGAGAEINHQDRDGNTALIWVAREVDNDIMQQLIGAGADMGLRDRCGRTAFLWAASLGHLATVQQLLAAGADASVRDQGGRTALDLAVANSRVGVEQFLKSMD